MKIAIGCLVQWYECEIAPLYFESLRKAIDLTKEYNPECEIIVDIMVCTNQDLEKSPMGTMLLNQESAIIHSAMYYGFNAGTTSKLVTIADYRRIFNDAYCDEVDLLMWGESDMLVPREAFISLVGLHKMVEHLSPKYLATFSMCKMWDSSWKVLEHPDFTDKPFIEGDTTNWWSLRYPMTLEEMYKINDRTEQATIIKLGAHKFNGCGLVISSEVIRSGVNIPKAMFFIHEDTAFMNMTQKVLGDIPQFHFKDLLLVHNRKHPLKRKSIQGEEGLDPSNPGLLRSQHDWYDVANKMSEENAYNLFKPAYKAKTWKDVFKHNK